MCRHKLGAPKFQQGFRSIEGHCPHARWSKGMSSSTSFFRLNEELKRTRILKRNSIRVYIYIYVDIYNEIVSSSLEFVVIFFHFPNPPSRCQVTADLHLCDEIFGLQPGHQRVALQESWLWLLADYWRCLRTAHVSCAMDRVSIVSFVSFVCLLLF